MYVYAHEFKNHIGEYKGNGPKHNCVRCRASRSTTFWRVATLHEPYSFIGMQTFQAILEPLVGSPEIPKPPDEAVGPPAPTPGGGQASAGHGHGLAAAEAARQRRDEQQEAS